MVAILFVVSACIVGFLNAQEICTTKFGKTPVQNVPTSTNAITITIPYITIYASTPIKTETPPPVTATVSSTTTFTTTSTVKPKTRTVTVTSTGNAHYDFFQDDFSHR